MSLVGQFVPLSMLGPIDTTELLPECSLDKISINDESVMTCVHSFYKYVSKTSKEMGDPSFFKKIQLIIKDYIDNELKIMSKVTSINPEQKVRLIKELHFNLIVHFVKKLNKIVGEDEAQMRFNKLKSLIEDLDDEMAQPIDPKIEEEISNYIKTHTDDEVNQNIDFQELHFERGKLGGKNKKYHKKTQYKKSNKVNKHNKKLQYKKSHKSKRHHKK